MSSLGNTDHDTGGWTLGQYFAATWLGIIGSCVIGGAFAQIIRFIAASPYDFLLWVAICAVLALTWWAILKLELLH